MSRGTIIIDADPLVYRVGFAAESHHHDCVFTDHKGNLQQRMFSPKDGKTAHDRFKEFQELHPEWEIISKEKRVEAEPINFALRGVRLNMDSIIREAGKYLKDRGVDEVTQVLYLTGKGNYREDIATILPYKGNRDPDHKPYHYASIREYLQKTWGALMITGHEADDECSIMAAAFRASNHPHIVCTIDKDLDQIPGDHYDYAKKVFYSVTQEDAEYMFWKQCISGDGVDNIQGCFRLGAKKAEGLLDDLMQGVRDAPGIWQGIIALYEQNIKKFPDKYPEGMTAEEAALETARLVKMQDYPGQLWTPPGMPDEVTT